MNKSKGYIYLDTNIISDLKSLSKNDLLAFRNAYQKYDMPFSHAHLLDFSNSSEEFLKEDLQALEIISRRKIIFTDSYGKIMLEYIPTPLTLYGFYMEVLRAHELEGKKTLQERKYFVTGYDKFPINTSILHKNSLLYKMAIQNKGILDGNITNAFMSYALEGVDNPTIYKELRRQVNDIVPHTKKYGTYNNIPERMQSILKVFSMNHDENSSILFDSLNDYMKISLEIQGGNFDAKSIPNKIVDIYLLLDLVKGFNEQIDKKNRWSNMLRDAEHCANAWKSTFFVTNDTKNIKRVRFIRQQFGLGFEILSLDEFLSKFRR